MTAWADRIPSGRALDLACGSGRNALWLAENGWTVDAVDIAGTALDMARKAAGERGTALNLIEADLDSYALSANTYDLIVICFYLSRPLAPRVVVALKPGGFVIHQHHYQTDHDVAGPKDKEFRLKPNELLDLYRGLRVRQYGEGLEQEGEETFAAAHIVAQKPPANHEPFLPLGVGGCLHHAS